MKYKSGHRSRHEMNESIHQKVVAKLKVEVLYVIGLRSLRSVAYLQSVYMNFIVVNLKIPQLYQTQRLKKLLLS